MKPTQKALEYINKRSPSVVRLEEIARVLESTKQYASRILKSLIELGEIEKIGVTQEVAFKGTNDRVQINNEGLTIEYKGSYFFDKTFPRVGVKQAVDEEKIYEQIDSKTNIIKGLDKAVMTKLRYAITEMINNAIDHSNGSHIRVVVTRDNTKIAFWVVDNGIGVFQSIKKKFKLSDEISGLEYLLKGKATTMPEKHSGEGIYFTSKIADVFRLDSHHIQFTINQKCEEDPIRIGELNDTELLDGTRVRCRIYFDSTIDMQTIFEESTDDDASFDKSIIQLSLIAKNNGLISRSIAKRIMRGSEKFNKIVLDFNNIQSIGQAFADEIFRVWQKQYPHISITYVNANGAIIFMIQRAFNAKP